MLRYDAFNEGETTINILHLSFILKFAKRCTHSSKDEDHFFDTMSFDLQ